MARSSRPRRLLLAPRAVQDLESIALFIGQDSAEHADKVITAITQTMDLLSEFPLIGRTFVTANESLTHIRFYAVRRYPSYGIYYQTSAARLLVLRVLHTSMDAPWHLAP
jgi:plasmid stabilization system protein ParE